MATYAVEVVITVEADNPEEAYEKAVEPLAGMIFHTYDDCVTEGD